MNQRQKDHRTPLFEIRDLHVAVEKKEILHGVSLKIFPGEVHAVMGRNGSGKTTLAYTLMGHPKYQVLSGSIFLNGEDITQCDVVERARKRLFLGFQYPVALPGVTVANFLRASIRSVRGEEVPFREVRKLIKSEIEKLNVPEAFMKRSLNEGFSGGEKKRLETLQMRLLQPHLAVLDETDSGLDIDALRTISQSINEMRDNHRSFLID